MPNNANKHHQKLNPVTYDAKTTIKSLKSHRIGKLLIILFMMGWLRV